MNLKKQNPRSTNELMRYAGLGSQIFVSLGIAVFGGYKIDGWLHLRFPLLVWLLPFAVLCMLIHKLIQETKKGKDESAQQQ